MTDEKKPPQGAVKGGERKKLTKSERLELARLDMLKIAPATVLDDRQRLACGLLCDAVKKLQFVANEPGREIERLKTPWRTHLHIHALRRRISIVTERVDALEALFRDPDDSFRAPLGH